MVGKHAKNAVSERLNNQIKEREEERKREIQRKREEELAALKSRSQSQSVLGMTARKAPFCADYYSFVFGISPQNVF